MKGISRYIPLALLLGLLTVVSVSVPAKSRQVLVDTSVQRKGEYYGNKGREKLLEEDLASGYELMRRALRYDNSHKRNRWDMSVLKIHISDNLDSIKSYRKDMEDYLDAFPGEVHERILYAELLGDMGDVPGLIEQYNKVLELEPWREDVYMQLLTAHLMMGESEKARETLETYEDIAGENLQTLMASGYVYMMTGDTVQAVNKVKRFMSKYPDSADAAIVLGSMYEIWNKGDSALIYYKRAEELAPTSAAPKTVMAKYYNQHGDSIKADSLMLAVMSVPELSIDEKGSKAMEYTSMLVNDTSATHDMLRVLPLFESLVEQDKENINYRIAIAQIYAMTPQKDKCRALYEEILRDFPQETEAWEALISDYYATNNYRKVSELYEEASDTLPRTTLRMDMLGAGAYSMLKQYEKAETLILKNIRFVMPEYRPDMLPDSVLANTIPNMPELNNMTAGWIQVLGDQYVSMGDTVKGFRVYDQALAIDPNNVMTLNNYAYFLALNNKDLDRAEEMSMRTVNAEPESSTYLDTYAYILFKKRDYERARMYQEMAIKNMGKEDESADIYSHYGDILFMLGEPAAALEQWKKALAIEPDNELLKRKVEHETYFYK